MKKIRKSHYPLLFGGVLMVLVIPAALYLAVMEKPRQGQIFQLVPSSNCTKIGNPPKNHKPCCPGLTSQYDKWSREWLCLRSSLISPIETRCVRSCANCDLNKDGKIVDSEIVGVHKKIDADCNKKLDGGDFSYCRTCVYGLNQKPTVTPIITLKNTKICCCYPQLSGNPCGDTTSEKICIDSKGVVSNLSRCSLPTVTPTIKLENTRICCCYPQLSGNPCGDTTSEQICTNSNGVVSDLSRCP